MSSIDYAISQVPLNDIIEDSFKHVEWKIKRELTRVTKLVKAKQK